MTDSITDKLPAQHLIKVEVAIALPQRQEVHELLVSRGCTALEAVEQSGLREKYRDYLDQDGTPALGIFSRPLNGVVLPMPQDYVLEEHDRVEIYRPLVTDPKQARRNRAQKKST